MKQTPTKQTATIISLAAYKAAKPQPSNIKAMPKVFIDIDCWYHQQHVDGRD